MGNPLSTTDYPVFAGATGKQDMLVELWAHKDSPGRMMTTIFRIAHTDLDALTDKSTNYNPDGIFTAIP